MNNVQTAIQNYYTIHSRVPMETNTFAICCKMRDLPALVNQPHWIRSMVTEEIVHGDCCYHLLHLWDYLRANVPALHNEGYILRWVIGQINKTNSTDDHYSLYLQLPTSEEFLIDATFRKCINLNQPTSGTIVTPVNSTCT